MQLSVMIANTVIAMSLPHADNFSTMVIASTDSPTTSDSESTEPGVITTTNAPTAYSLVSDGVPTAIGVVCFLVLLVGLLVGLFAAVIYLHSKRKSKKRYTVDLLSSKSYTSHVNCHCYVSYLLQCIL